MALSGTGFAYQIGGYSESCCDYLTVKTSWDGGSADWVEGRENATLTEAAGSEVTFTFTSDARIQEGNGILMDDFVIGGMQVDLVNPELLEQGGHDGHDHEH